MYRRALVLLAFRAAYLVVSYSMLALSTSGIPADVTAYWFGAERVRDAAPWVRAHHPQNAIHEPTPALTPVRSVPVPAPDD